MRVYRVHHQEDVQIGPFSWRFDFRECNRDLSRHYGRLPTPYGVWDDLPDWSWNCGAATLAELADWFPALAVRWLYRNGFTASAFEVPRTFTRRGGQQVIFCLDVAERLFEVDLHRYRRLT